MKKILYTLALVLPVTAIMYSSSVNAKDYTAKYEREYEKETADIKEDYDEAIRRLEKTTFSTEQRAVLMSQADANRDLAMKQIKEIRDLRAKQNGERNNFLADIEKSYENRKAIGEIDDILDY